MKPTNEPRIDEVIEARLEAIKNTPKYAWLKSYLENFEDSPNDMLVVEDGYLFALTDIDMSEVLGIKTVTPIDWAFAAEVLQSCTDGLGFVPLVDSRYFEWQVSFDLGQPVIFNPEPEPNECAIYANELNLKVDRVISERHGFLLIERAMRKAGVYPWLVGTDSDGVAFKLEMPSDISAMPDNVLSAAIDEVESA